MSSRASYVVIRDNTAQVYLDRHGGAYCVTFLADGPEGAATEAASMAGDDEVSELLSWHMAEGGLLIDFDERLATVHG